MTFQEKRSLVTLIATTAISIGYFIYIFTQYANTDPQTMNDLSFWGRAVLILIPVQIVLIVLAHIVFHIGYAAVSREKLPARDDERDKLIQLKATRNSYYVFSGGFFLAMTALALNLGPFVMFLVLISAALLSGVVESVSQLYFYRRGF
ncbi:MAG: hypothetical protein AAGN35_18355 [Bacteroidota bacterium]